MASAAIDGNIFLVGIFNKGRFNSVKIFWFSLGQTRSGSLWIVLYCDCLLEPFFTGFKDFFSRFLTVSLHGDGPGKMGSGEAEW